jgi:hypothetical protein
MSPRAGDVAAVTEGRLKEALDEALVAAAVVAVPSLGPSQLPEMRRAYLEIENSVFLLKVAAKDDGGPAYDSSLEALGRDELLGKMSRGLKEARELAGVDPVGALAQARVARDCAAAALHSLNLESRRRRK